MDSRDGQSRPYGRSGNTAAHRVIEPRMHASFADLLTPPALEQRAQDVQRRGRSRQFAGIATAAVMFGLAAVLGTEAGVVFDGSLDGMILSNFLMLGSLLGIAAAFIAWTQVAKGARLIETADLLRRRANHVRNHDRSRP